MISGFDVSLSVGKGMETRLLCHCECPGVLPKAKPLGTKLISILTWKGRREGEEKEEERKGGREGMEVGIEKPHMKVLQVIVKLDERESKRDYNKHTCRVRNTSEQTHKKRMKQIPTTYMYNTLAGYQNGQSGVFAN